jgi:ferredoxin hydrogenase large subunit
MSKTHDESRRGFLKTVGVAVGAAVAVGAGCSAAPKKNTGPALSSGGGRVDVEKVDTIMKAPDYREIDRLYFVQVDEKKCEACGQCQDICATGAIQAAGDDGPRKIVDPAVCMNCGQCLANCPYGAIYECGSFVDEIFEKIKDPDVQVVAMPAPAVRYGLGECFGMPLGTYVGKKMFTALRKLGFDHIWDNQFTADVTIMEEGSELVGRIKNPDKKKPLPQFTSCCPAWIKFVETFHPEILPHISTCKSPIGMLGPLSKTYGAKVKKTDPSKIYTVSIMPCIAKKYEGCVRANTATSTRPSRPGNLPT